MRSMWQKLKERVHHLWSWIIHSGKMVPRTTELRIFSQRRQELLAARYKVNLHRGRMYVSECAPGDRGLDGLGDGYRRKDKP